MYVIKVVATVEGAEGRRGMYFAGMKPRDKKRPLDMWAHSQRKATRFPTREQAKNQASVIGYGVPVRLTATSDRAPAADTKLRRMTLDEWREKTGLLRRLREAMGLTMGEAARSKGCSVASWSAEEMSKGTIGHGLLEEMVRASEDKRERAKKAKTK